MANTGGRPGGPAAASAMLWYSALLELALGALMVIASELFASDIYRTINGSLGIVAATFLVAGCVGLLTLVGLWPRRALLVVWVLVAVPPLILAYDLLQASVTSGVLVYSFQALGLVAWGVWSYTRRGRPPVRFFVLFVSATLTGIGTAMVVASDSFSDQLTFADLANYLWLIAPLFLVGGVGLGVTEIAARRSPRSSRWVLAFASVAAIDCGILVMTFTTTHVWTGVLCYGLMAVVLLIAAPRWAVWAETPVLFAAMAAVGATGDLMLSLLAKAGAARLYPDTALLHPIAALGIAYIAIAFAILLNPVRAVARRLTAVLSVCAAALALLGIASQRGAPTATPDELLGRTFAPAVSPSLTGMLLIIAAAAIVLLQLARPRTRALPQLYVAFAALLIGHLTLNVLAYMESSEDILAVLGPSAMRQHATVILGSLAIALAAAGAARLIAAPIRDRLFGAVLGIGILVWIRSSFGDSALAHVFFDPSDFGLASYRDTIGDALGAISIVILALTAAAAVLFLRTVTIPLETVMSAIARARAGEARAQALVDGEDEIALVAHSFNQLTRDLADQSELNAAVRGAQSDLGEATVVTDRGRAVEWNEALARITGYNDVDLRGMHLLDLVPSDRRADTEQVVYAHRNTEYRFETALLRRNGEHADIEVAVAPLPALGARTQLVLIRDISVRKNAERALERTALHDALTDLPNRAAFIERVAAQVHRESSGAASFAIVYLDIDRFKEVNDAFGHGPGDALLKDVAGRLGRALPSADMIARFGGDEFAVLMCDAHDLETATGAADLVRSALQQPFELRGHHVFLEASIGIARYPTDGADAETLLRHADVAMYDAKRSGKVVAVYAPDIDPQNERRLALMSDLRHAIERDQLFLHFQPQIRLASGGSCASVEALVRWKHPVRGMVSPGDFIPLAEGSGFISELTRWVIGEAIGAITSLRDLAVPPRLALNISARDLHDPSLVDAVEEALQRTHLDPSSLTIEITETAVMSDARRSLETLGRLAALGVRLSIDDFGAGYSSLAYLRRLPVNELKIDRMFVADMLANPSSDAIVSSVIQLGHSLGLSVVAEGVEDAATQAALRAGRCDIAQGYHIARPMPIDALRAWLTARHDSVEIATAAD